LNKTYESVISSVDYVAKEDLDLVNHLSGKQQKYLKLSFKSIQDLMTVKSELLLIVEKNQREKETQEAYEGWYNPSDLVNQQADTQIILSKILEIREYDVPYHIRVCIDKELRCSFWYQIEMEGPKMVKYEHLKSKLDKADLRILAFDIETSKAPLKFPDSRFD